MPRNDRATCRPACAIGYNYLARLLLTPFMNEASAGQSLTLDDIVHRYASSVAVDHVTLEIAAGELVALLGPSGCGKTTLLRIVAGFIAQTSGKVVVGGKRIDDLPPNRRNIGIVFQNYALFPHMTVAENVGYGLAARGTTSAATKKRTAEMLELVQLGHLAARLTKQLSGGQQQRVALARALAIEPRVLLLDEPFSALDKSLRLDMQIEIKRIQRAAGTTAIIVTHDQEEALGMADRVAVLSAGKLEQFAAPSAVYDTPATYFVNQFVGTANVFAGTLESMSADSAVVRMPDGRALHTRLPATGVSVGSKVIACVRPENLRLGDSADGVQATVELGMPLGATIVHEIRTANGQRLKLSEPRDPGAVPRDPGTSVWVRPVSPTSVTVFAAP
ncbi:MAG: Fe3+/spermidine/putrescine transporter ATP-binding protein [Rhizobacter sp.]|nr:Fe3+/spermidine/putrescine transporter ATP-binding protein [Rhizobacter sp.]